MREGDSEREIRRDTGERERENRESRDCKLQNFTTDPSQSLPFMSITDVVIQRRQYLNEKYMSALMNRLMELSEGEQMRLRGVFRKFVDNEAMTASKLDEEVR